MKDATACAKECSKDDETLTSPPPSKKLKQARLPFKVLTPKSDANISSPGGKGAQKKRKMLEGATGPVKAPKTPRSNEKNKAKVAEHDAENKSTDSKQQSVKKDGPLGKFVKLCTDKKCSEPTVSGSEMVVDLTEKEEQEEVTAIKEAAEKSSEDGAEEKETECMTKEEEEKDPAGESLQATSTDTLKSPMPTSAADSLKSPQPTKEKTAKTPVSSRKSIGKEERERLRKEREEKKLKEKEEKEKQKQEEKERKDREKEEKRKRFEEEKKEKLKQKEEEKKKKFEEKRLEQEQKEKEKDRLKEEKELEKQRLKEEKELEKQKAELEKLQVTQKQKSLFQNFFTKKETDDVAEEKCEDASCSLFMPFQVKADTRLAPIRRVKEMELQERIKKFNPLFEAQNTQKLYLEELKKTFMKLGGSELSTWPFVADDSCCMLLDSEGGQEEISSKKERMKVKLLQFHENYRPAYYGTWQKISNTVTARRPLGKDTGILDYEVDSDEEWEEEEPGESLSASEDDDKEEEKEDEDENEDGFFVPHGYLSEGEGCEDEEEDDVTPERLKARQLAKARAFELAQSKKTVEVLKPKAVGCCWQEPGKTLNLMEQVLEQFKMVILHSCQPIPVVENRGDESMETQKKANKKDKHGLQNVPQEAYGDLIRLVHGNKFGLLKLIKEFREFWYVKEGGKSTTLEEAADCKSPAGDKEASPDNTKAKKYSISKRQLEKTIKKIAVYEKRGTSKNCWYVNDNVLEKYKLKDLQVPTNWQWITRANPPAPVKAESPLPSTSAQGRVTPKLDTPKQMTNSITKFTVAGLTPKVHEPTPVRATKAVEEASAPKAAKSIVDMFNKAPKRAAKALAPNVETANIIKLDGDAEDSDCAVVKMELNVEKNQPSVKSMFRPTKKKSEGIDDLLAKGKSPPGKRMQQNTSKGDGEKVASEESRKPLPKKAPGSVVKKKKGDLAVDKTKPGVVRKKSSVAKVTNSKGADEKKKSGVVRKKSTATKNKMLEKLPSAKPNSKEKPENVKGAGTESSPMEID